MITCPVQAQTTCRIFYRRCVGSIVSVAHEVAVYATPLVVVGDRLVDDIPFRYAVHSRMFQHAFNPCFHGTQQGGFLFFGSLELISDATVASRCHGRYGNFLERFGRYYYIINQIRTGFQA